MSLAKTGIPYIDSVWNVTRGCSHCGPACANCYAERIARRFCGHSAPEWRDYAPFAGFADENGWTGRVELLPDKLDAPLRARKPQRIGVCFTGDLFHESLPDEDLLSVFDVIRKSKACGFGHTFVLLTKRWKRMYEFCSALRWDDAGPGFLTWGGAGINPMPLMPIWLGVTAWDQPSLDAAAGYLLRTPAALRWVSLEPLLGTVSIPEAIARIGCFGMCAKPNANGDYGIDWVVAGCESGPGRRQAETDWFRALRDQCEVAGVPFYLKQAASDDPSNTIVYGDWREYKRGDVIEHPFLDGRQWLQIPEVRR